MPSITVITPTIPGREDLLAQCRASVAALHLPHLVALDAHGRGPAAMRNTLAVQASTPWLLFLDDDDLLLPNYLDAVTPHLADADVVYTDWELDGAAFPAPAARFDPTVLRQYNYIPVTACVRAARFAEVGGFPLDATLEDHSLWLALLDAGARFVHVPVIAWRYRRQSSTRNI